MKETVKKLQNSIWTKLLIAALFPIVCCFVYCLTSGHRISDFFLPASEWNDELFYYKQVESILSHKIPQGFYGFNESQALRLTFAAWSPVLLAPWLLWGLIFGWTLTSPIYCNIFLMSLALVLFVALVKPNWKQLGVFGVFFVLFKPFVRYMFCCMPEITCFALVIIFYSLAINYLNREKSYKLVILFILAGLMTLMRPYLILFLLLPIYLIVRKRKWIGVLISAAAMSVILLIYYLIKHYLSAEYFKPLFFTDWLTTFFTDGFVEGFKHFVGKFYWMGLEFTTHMISGIRDGLASGIYFICYIATMIVLIIRSVCDIKKYRKTPEASEKNMIIIESHLALSFFGMLIALLLMYKMTEGSKHLATFLAAGILIVSLFDLKRNVSTKIQTGLLILIFGFLYIFKARDAYNYQAPFIDGSLAARYETIENTLSKEMILSDDGPSFDNVIIWTLQDMVSSGDSDTPVATSTEWQALYYLPKGFGINCCEYEYVKENLGSLKSKYIMTLPQGDLNKTIKEQGYSSIYEDDNISIYRLR